MLHAGAAGLLEVLADAEGVGDVFEVGLGEPALAGLQRLHVTHRCDGVDRDEKRRGLGRVGAVSEVVFFASAMPPPPSAFKLKQLEKKGLEPDPPDRPVVLGRLYRPESEGPHPAVVLLSAARGISIWDDTWAARLRDWGYLVLDVDSLTPRGLYSHNTGREKPRSARRKGS